MRDILRAETLLSLFTSADRAQAIAGDLIEAEPDRGPILFWLGVVGIATALWWRAVMDAPLRVLMLAILGCVLLIGPTIIGVAAVAVFPASIHSPLGWIALLFIWSAGATQTGSSLVSASPARGMSACATLAGIGEPVLIALALGTPQPDLSTVPLALAYTAALLAPVLLLLGGAMEQRRILLGGAQ
jgi:hypothetical protein